MIQLSEHWKKLGVTIMSDEEVKEYKKIDPRFTYEEDDTDKTETQDSSNE